MKKSYAGRYPELKNKQFDFTRAVVSMLNCRRYLESEGFNEDLEDFWFCSSISGTIVFPDESIVDSYALTNTKDTNARDSLLERMINKKAVFKRPAVNSIDLFNSIYYDRNEVIMTRFKENGYTFKLSVADTTREKAIIPIRWFLIKPRCFGFKYDICLKKSVITDADLTDFEKYGQGLFEAAKSDVLLAYSPSSVKINTSAVAQPKTLEIIDPWKVDIDELEAIAYGGRK